MKIIKIMKNDIYVPDMVKTFQLPESSLSKHCLEVIADVLGAEKKSFDDDYDITILDNIVIEKYKEVLESFSKENSHGFKTSFSVSGVSLNFGWGDNVLGTGYGINGVKTYE